MNALLRPKVQLAIAAAIFLAYLLFVALLHYQGRQQAAEGGTPFFNDFTSNYAASQMLRNQPAANLYLEEHLYPAERAAANAAYGGTLSDPQTRIHGYAAWLYPPLFILLCLPLAAFSHLTAYLLWLLVTAVPYVAAVRQILPARYAWPLVLAAPPTFFNLIYGQTGYLTAGLIGLGLSLLQRYPTLAGICIGCAAFKPQFGILIPFALLAGRFWWPFVVATTTVIASIAASIIAFGDDPWFAFIGTQLRNFDGFAAGAYNLNAMVTPFSAIRLAGASIDQAWAGQGLISLLMLGLTLWSWGFGARRDPHFCLRPALLCCAALLATPMAYLYDLPLLVLAAAWLLLDMQKENFRKAEPILLLGALSLTLGLKEIAVTTHLQLGPLLSALLLLQGLYRMGTHQSAR